MRLPFGYELRKVKGNVTCLHPDFKTLVEFAFMIDGVEYYQFKNLLDMPPIRYKKHEEFIRECELRMTGKDALELLQIAEDKIEVSKATDAIMILRGMKYQIEQFIEVDTFYRLFSCLFFTLDEDLTKYDYDYNEEKIKAFKSEPISSFFFQHPLKEWLPAADISKQDLEVFLKQSNASKQNLQRIKSEITKD